MVDFTAKHIEVATNSFTVVPTTHDDDLSDICEYSDTLTSSITLVSRIIDHMYSHDINSNTLEAYVSNIDTTLFADALYQLRENSLSDTVLSEDSIGFTLEKISQLIDTMVNSDSINNQLDAISYLAVTALFEDILDQALFETLSDTSQYTDTLTTQFIHIVNQLDTCLFSDSLTGTKYINVALSDTVVSDANISNVAEMFGYLIDSVSWYGTLGLDGNDYLVYVMNTETHAISEYDNFPFNSMSQNLAASSDGIFRLSGDDDNGIPIKARIKTGLMDFGTSLQKQSPFAYLGITSNGKVLIKTTTTYRGVKKERIYKVESTNETFDSVRGKLSKGVKSRYWQFELSNYKGSKFELESVEFTVLVLNRRAK